VKKVSRFKYATWNIRGLGEKEEALDKTLNENILVMKGHTSTTSPLPKLDVQSYVYFLNLNRNPLKTTFLYRSVLQQGTDLS